MKTRTRRTSLNSLGIMLSILGAGCSADSGGLSSNDNTTPIIAADNPNPVQFLRVVVDPNDGSKFVGLWNAPLLNSVNSNAADYYEARWFKGDQQTSFVEFDNLPTPEVSFSPSGTLGRLEVYAHNENGISNVNEVTIARLGFTQPYYITLADINDEGTIGPSGIRWTVDDSSLGHLGYFTTDMQSSADTCDFYMTNFLPDLGSPPHYFASPHLAAEMPADAAVVSTVEGLAHSELLDVGTTPPNILPDPNETPYTDMVEIVAGHYYAVKTEDGFFGTIFVKTATGGGRLGGQMRVWATPIRGSRVFGLEINPDE